MAITEEQLRSNWTDQNTREDQMTREAGKERIETERSLLREPLRYAFLKGLRKAL